MSARIILSIEEDAKDPGHIAVQCVAAATEDATPHEKVALAKLQTIVANAISESNRVVVDKSYVVGVDGVKYEKYPWESIEDAVARMRKDYEKKGVR